MITVKTKEYAVSDWMGPVERIEVLTEGEAAGKYKNHIYKRLTPAYSNSDSRVYACEVSEKLEKAVFSIEGQAIAWASRIAKACRSGASSIRV